LGKWQAAPRWTLGSMELSFIKENGKSFKRFGSLNKGLDQSQRNLKVK